MSIRTAAATTAAVLLALVGGYLLGTRRDDGNDPRAASPIDAAGSDTAQQSELLEERLSRLPPQQIVDFARFRRQLDERAYTWDIWGAAYLIEDGCSDDCFRDFRAYLISLGRPTFERALRDPDSLADVVQDAEAGNWENADNVAPDAYESATGEDIPVDDSDPSGPPRGEAWDDESQETLVRRYPALAARFREAPAP